MSIDFNSVSDWINKQVAAGKLLHYDVDGAKLDMIDFSDRKMVLANVLGEKVPFYLSTGQAGKKNVPAGKWYPFFGVGEDGWINKTTQAEIASYYNNPYFKKIGEALDKNIGDLRPYSIGQDAELGHFHDIHKIVGDASGLYGVSHSDKDAYNKIITTVSAVSQRMYDAAKAQKSGSTPPPGGANNGGSTPPPGGANNGGSTPPPGGAKPPPEPQPAPSGGKSTNKISSLFENHSSISIDIETSGRDAAKDKIWNVGLKWSNGKKKNLFLVDDADYVPGYTKDANILERRQKVVDRLKAQLESNDFGKKQAKLGNFDALYDAIHKGRAISSAGGARYISNIIGALGEPNNPKFTLIQNARFEDSFLTKLFQDHGVFDKAKNGMEFRTDYTDKFAGFLYSPPEITTLKAQAGHAFEKYLAGSGSFDEVAKYHQGIIDSYIHHVATSKKGISVDLMDLTKSLYVNAAQKGLLRKQDAYVGTNVEFLSQLFWDKAESHTGLEDAELQERIAKEKIAGMHDRLNANALTDEDRNVFLKASEMQKRAHRLQLIQGLKTGLEESQTAAGYKLTGQRDFKSMQPVKDSNNVRRPMMVYRQQDAHYTKNTAATIDDVIQSSARRLEVHPDEVKSILDEIGKHKETSDKISALYEMGDNYWGKPAIPHKPMPGAAEVPKEPTGWYKSLSGAQKVAVGVGLASIIYMGASDDNASKNKIKQIKERKEYQERRYDLDSNMRIYGKLETYHGSGFADWDSRTKHHEY